MVGETKEGAVAEDGGDDQRQREFRETAPWEQGFAALYRDQLWPELRAIEERRAEQWSRKSKLTKGMFIAAGVSLLIGLASPFYTSAWPGFLLVGLLATLVFLVTAFLSFASADRAHREAVTSVVFPVAMEHIGGFRHHEREADLDQLRALDSLREIGQAGRFTRYTIDDLMRGQWRGVDFELAEVRLVERPRPTDDESSSSRGARGEEEVFSGMTLLLDRPGGAGPTAVVQSKNAEVPEPMPPGLEEQSLDSDLFGLKLRAFAASEADLDQALADDVRDGIARWLETLGGARVTLFFVEEKIVGTFEIIGDTFGVGAINESLETLDDDLHRLLADLSMPHRLIDILLHQPGEAVLPDEQGSASEVDEDG